MSSDELTVSGSAGRPTQALRVLKARNVTELVGDISDEEGEDGSGLSTVDDEPRSGASSQTHARPRKGSLPFSGLAPVGKCTVVDGPSYLELCSVTQEMRERYIHDFDAVLTSAKTVGKTATDAEIQMKLFKCLLRLFLKGHGVSKVQKLMSALLFTHPEFGNGGPRHALRFVRALMGYAKRAPTGSRKATTFAEVCAIANQLWLQDQCFMAIYVRLAFGARSWPTVALLLRVHDLVVPTRAWSDRWSIALKRAQDHRILWCRLAPLHASMRGIFNDGLLWESRDLLFLSTIFRAVRLEYRTCVVKYKRSQASSEGVMLRRRPPQWVRWIVG